MWLNHCIFEARFGAQQRKNYQEGKRWTGSKGGICPRSRLHRGEARAWQLRSGAQLCSMRVPTNSDRQPPMLRAHLELSPALSLISTMLWVRYLTSPSCVVHQPCSVLMRIKENVQSVLSAVRLFLFLLLCAPGRECSKLPIAASWG